MLRERPVCLGSPPADAGQDRRVRNSCEIFGGQRPAGTERQRDTVQFGWRLDVAFGDVQRIIRGQRGREQQSVRIRVRLCRFRL
jgi:hypothetical protein